MQVGEKHNKQMETPANLIESLFEKAEAYGKTSYELSKLRTLETSTTVVTTLIARLGVIIMISLFVLVLTIGVALLLGEWLGKSYYGFFIVAVFYLIAAIVLHFNLLKWIKKPVSDLIITQSLK
jgi:hypothetical protein